MQLPDADVTAAAELAAQNFLRNATNASQLPAGCTANADPSNIFVIAACSQVGAPECRGLPGADALRSACSALSGSGVTNREQHARFAEGQSVPLFPIMLCPPEPYLTGHKRARAHACMQVVAGTNYDIVFRVDDPCLPGTNAPQDSVTLEAQVYTPLPYTNAPMNVTNVHMLDA